MAPHPRLASKLSFRDICISTPRLGDTNIFFLDSIKTNSGHQRQAARFNLTDSILKVNLRNLKVLWKLEKNQKGNYSVYIYMDLLTVWKQ